MFYVLDQCDLAPATYARRDEYLALTTERRVPHVEAAGGRLIGAWTSNDVRFARITELWAHPDLDSVIRARPGADLEAEIEAMAPVRTQRLMEPLGPIGPEVLDAAIAAAADRPNEVYTFAHLDVAPGRLADFVELLDGVKDTLPLIASLRDVVGRRSQVLDVWSVDVDQSRYQPNTPALDGFLTTLREVAPDEAIKLLHPLPHSPLR